MKEIYFKDHTDSVGKSLKKRALGVGTYTLAKSLPSISNKLAEKVLCTPIKPANKKRIPDDFERSYIEVLGQKISIYKKGSSDKVILFSHGWSANAFNFSSFFKEYLDQGYSVIAFDHIAHGYSEGSISNYYYFYSSLKVVYNELAKTNNIVGIVGHSMGASALIGAQLPSHLKLCLISPLVPVFESLYENVKGFGLSGFMVSTFLKSYESRFKIKLEEIDPKVLIKKMSNDSLIIHSQDDQFIRHEQNDPFYTDKQKSKLLLLDGLGHFRILKSQDVINKSLEFMNGK